MTKLKCAELNQTINMKITDITEDYVIYCVSTEEAEELLRLLSNFKYSWGEINRPTSKTTHCLYLKNDKVLTSHLTKAIQDKKIIIHASTILDYYKNAELRGDLMNVLSPYHTTVVILKKYLEDQHSNGRIDLNTEVRPFFPKENEYVETYRDYLDYLLDVNSLIKKLTKAVNK